LTLGKIFGVPNGKKQSPGIVAYRPDEYAITSWWKNEQSDHS